MEDPGTIVKDLIAYLVFRNNYWGYLFSKVNRQECKTLRSIMGVAVNNDGTLTLLYNPNFFEDTPLESLKLIIEHEGMHLLNKHLQRFLRILAVVGVTNENKKLLELLWNYASDCAANEQMKMPQTIKVHGEDWPACHPEKFNLPPKKITEFYYNELLKDKEKYQQKVKVLMMGGGGEGSGNGGSGGDGEKNIDDHSTWTKELNESSDIGNIISKVDANISELIQESYKNCVSKGRGTLPGYLEELVQQYLEPPKLPYYQMIRKLIVGSRWSKYKSCPTRVNRKRTYAFCLGSTALPAISPFPGKKKDTTFHVGLLIDTSGSQSLEDMMEGLSCSKSIIENDHDCLTTVIENDTDIKAEYEIKKISDIQMKFRGRGGTILAPGLKRFKDIGVDIVICFTDGYTDNIAQLPRKSLPKKIIWVVPKNRGSIEMFNGVGYCVRTD